MVDTIAEFHDAQAESDREICDLLAREINDALPEAESKIWHGHPVWFISDNPIVGYSKLKDCVRLLFWSGQSFDTGGWSQRAVSRPQKYVTLTGTKWILTGYRNGLKSHGKFSGITKTSSSGRENSNDYSSRE